VAIDTTTSSVTARVAPVPEALRVLAINPNGSLLYAAGVNVYVIDTATATIVNTVAIDDASGIAFSSDGAQA